MSCSKLVVESTKKKNKKQSQLVGKVKSAIRILEGDPSTTITAAANAVSMCHKSLKKHYLDFKGSGVSLRDWIPSIDSGRPVLLNDLHKRALKLFAYTLDYCGYPISRHTLKDAIQKLSGLIHPPSKSYLMSLISELELPFRKVRNGLEIREVKSNIDFLSDFYSTLGDLLKQYQFRPIDIFNTDEVGIQIASRTIHLFTSRAVIRRNLVGDGHLTVLFTTNADGQIFKPFFIFPGTDLSCIPSGSFQNDVYTSFNTSAYMDEEQFQQWLSCFINEIASERLQNGILKPILLIVDGHSSRLNPTTVLTAACHNIILLCLPSHMTHLLQPNDCFFNKTVKDNLQHRIVQLVEVREEITRGELAAMVSESILEKNISPSIVQSFKHTGICPFDSLRMTEMLGRESVQPFPDEDQSLIDIVVNLTQEELSKKEHLCAQKRKREEATPSVRNCRFSTKKARVLTATENQAALRHAKELTGIESLKVADLRAHMTTKLSFSPALLHKNENSNEKWKTKKQLIAMIYRHYDEKWEETVSRIEEEITRNIVVAAPTAAMQFAPQATPN